MSARDRFAATYLVSETATRRRKKRHKSGSEYSYVGSDHSYSSSRKGHSRIQSSPMLHSRNSSPQSATQSVRSYNPPQKDYTERKRRRRRDGSYSPTSVASLDRNTLTRRFFRQQSASTGHLLENRKQKLKPDVLPNLPKKARSHTGASSSTFQRLSGDRNGADPPKDRKTKKRRSNPKSEKSRSDGGGNEHVGEERKTKKKKRSDHPRSDRGRSGSSELSEEEPKKKKKKRRSDQSDKSRSDKRRSDESRDKHGKSDKSKRRSDESKRKKRRNDETEDLSTRRRSSELKRKDYEADKGGESKNKKEASKKRSGESGRTRNSGSVIDSVKSALDEEYKKKQDPKSKRKHTSDTHDTIGSIATIEAYNLIDERLLEDIPPRKLSFLKAEAERKYEQSEKRIRRKWRNHEHNLSEADILDVQTYGEGFRSAQMQRIKNLIPKR